MTRAGPADPVRAAEFSRRYLAGETLQSLASDHSISRERVRQVLRAAGTPSLGQRKRPLTDVGREAARLYAGGVPPGVIEKQLGVSRSLILLAVKKAGVGPRPPGRQKRPDDAEITAKVAELYLAGVPTAEIARRTGLKDQPRIYRYLKRAGVGPHRGAGGH